MTQDWPLISHLWTGWLPQYVDEANQLRLLGEMYWACSNKLQVHLLATATSSEHWVNIPPLLASTQLMVDTHVSLDTVGGMSCLAPYVVPVGGQV